MTDAQFHLFTDRCLIRVDGVDQTSFLQGLVSNNVENVTPEQAGYGAFLTAQGKFLHDFFMAVLDGGLVLDTEADRSGDFLKKLKIYKLRSKIQLSVVEDWTVAVVFGQDALNALDLPAERGAAKAFAGGIAFVDPRLVEIGARVILPSEGAADRLAEAGLTEGAVETYERRRMGLGLPDGGRDMAVEKTVLLEAGFEELGGVDFKKGCYMGQELTARTKYRGLVKRRLMPVAIDGPMPGPGTEITLNGKEAGELRSVVGTGQHGEGLAMIRLNRLDEAFSSGLPLMAGEATVIPRKPAWAKF
jgi:hypothetical protein